MPKFPTIPDFSNDPHSIVTALRAMKDILEQLAGLRQGTNLGAPSLFIQPIPPQQSTQLKLKTGDMWINAEVSRASTVTSKGNLYYWDGAIWQQLTNMV